MYLSRLKSECSTLPRPLCVNVGETVSAGCAEDDQGQTYESVLKAPSVRETEVLATNNARFTGEYKEGDEGALLRREGLYSSHLAACSSRSAPPRAEGW